eukprot:m.73053 g.73053  ORF g.73053 m.73053 type:complete len:659 (+) comp14304_c0_seq1:86-2062(+)
MALIAKYGLSIGSSINIKRSDGRVHAAAISGCNDDGGSVTVEWFENEEMKGKEVDFHGLIVLNSLQAVQPPASKPVAAVPAPAVPVPASSNSRERRKSPKAVRREVTNPPVKSQAPAPSKAPSKSEGIQPFQASNPNLKKGDKKIAMMIDDCRARMDIRPFPATQEVFMDKITVCVRKRPLFRRETDKGEMDCVTMPDGELTVVHEAKEKVDLTKYIENHEFRFDYSFEDGCDNEVVYRYTAAPLVRTIFERGMATCFAYGQTGSGKTHTMGGSGPTAPGVYLLAARDVFSLNAGQYAQLGLAVSVSFFEIYAGKVFDLLNKQKRLRVLEDAKNKVQVVGLSEKQVHSTAEVGQLLDLGSRCRATGTTSANAASSRSHAVFQIILRKSDARAKLHGKFSLIDLAGNERGADTANSDRQTRMEGAEINKSLLALKECIRALGRKGSHTPFRASKLTQVLRDSFINPRARTCMIAMISPGRASCEHSLNTLRYANRVKELAPGKRRQTAVPSEPAPEPEEDDDEEVVAAVSEEDQSSWRQDLAMLHMSIRSRGEADGEADGLFDFQEAVANLQEAEERMVEEHRAGIQFNKEMLMEEEKLLDDVESPQGDVEDYARRLDAILATKIEKLQHLRDNLSGFRTHLKQEESASKNVKQGMTLY